MMYLPVAAKWQRNNISVSHEMHHYQKPLLFELNK